MMYWVRDRSIFILIVLLIMYKIFKPTILKLRYRLRCLYGRLLKGEVPPPEVMEYSIEDSIKYGFRDSTGKIILKRPFRTIQHTKSVLDFNAIMREKAKVSDPKYRKAVRRIIPISYLYDNPNKRIKNRTLRAYAEEVFDNEVILRDFSAVYKLKLDGCYPIAGEHVLININKKGDEVKVNYILNNS